MSQTIYASYRPLPMMAGVVLVSIFAGLAGGGLLFEGRWKFNYR